MIEDVLKRICDRLDRIEMLLAEPEVKPILVGLSGLQKMLGCSSPSAANRRAEEFGIKSVTYGKYRIKDIENAIARMVVEKQAATNAENAAKVVSSKEEFNGQDAKWKGKQ